MSISKRGLLYGVAGATAALAGSGALFAVTRTPTRANQAWKDIDTGAPRDVRLDAFRHAILAPNPHNRQPWIIELVGENLALIRCDLNRRLPMTDPFDRQILIGFGCFLETARIAAAQRGVRMEIEPFPQGLPDLRLDARPIAALRFVPDPAVEKDALFPFIAARRSNKRPYDVARAVPSNVLAQLSRQKTANVEVKTSNEAAMLQSLRALSWEAWLIELKTARTWQETVDLMRIGKAEIEANPDGVSIGGAFLEALALTGQISREQMARPGSTAYATAISRYEPVMASGMAYAWIVTQTNTRAEQLAAGYAYLRMNLEATRQGLGFHPISQALQEFDEMKGELAKVHGILGARPQQRVQMLMRLGYGDSPNVTPRWPLRSKITGA
jgi:nitroreductase